MSAYVIKYLQLFYMCYNIYMELEDKKDHVIRCIRLGMDLKSSMYCAECTEEEMDQLSNDPAFKHKVQVVYSIKEKDLLEDHALAMRIAAATGKTSAIQWKLERLNKDRWGSGNNKPVSEDDGERETQTVIYIPDNGR